MTQTTHWIENHVYPHQIIGLSIYEEEHPNETNEVNATVYFKGPEHDKINLPEEIEKPLFKYDMKLYQGEWDQAYDEAIE